MNSTVWLNGHWLGDHPYGYTTFEYELSPHLSFGNCNTIAVRVVNQGPDAVTLRLSVRGIAGSGLLPC